MDPEAMAAHLHQLLTAEQDLLRRIEEHRMKLLTHQPSRERDRALRQAQSSLRRHDKARRRLERALRVQA
ncbi:MAG: hypothetical protein ABR586_03985 [Thermoplasmatota archaeon]|jgi:hypothetical protein